MEITDEAVEAGARLLDPPAWEDQRSAGQHPFIAFYEPRTIEEIWADRRDMARERVRRILSASAPYLQQEALAGQEDSRLSSSQKLGASPNGQCYGKENTDGDH